MTSATQWLTTAEAAHELRVTVETARDWIRSGRVPATRFGRIWRVRAADIATLAGHPAATPAVEPAPAVRPADTARAAIAAARAANKADAWRQEVLGFLNAHPGKAYYLQNLRRAITSPLPADPHAFPAQLEAWVGDGTIHVDGAGPYRAYKSADPAPAP